MFTVSHTQDKLLTYTLRDEESNAEVQIAPTRGGMATRFHVANTPVFFMDDDSLYDLSKNVRGGNPILFPIAGPVKDNTYTWNNTSFELKQHGFARNESWSVESSTTEAAATLTIALRSSEEIKKRFPFDFEVLYTYSLRGKTLRLTQTYRNLSQETMPLHAGFHPYFYVPASEKAQTTIATHATHAFDNVTKQRIGFFGFDLTTKEVDLHLYYHGATQAVLQRPNGAPAIIVRGSAEFTHWVVWTLQGKDFVCLEPWTAPGNALNTKERLLWLTPGEEKTLWVEFSLGESGKA